MSMWIAIAAAMLLVGFGFAVRNSKKGKSLSVLTEREALSDDEIYRRFYASSNLAQAEVKELWHEIARALRVPAERMRPEDKFGKDIGTYWITSEELDELGAIAQQRAKQKGLSVDLATIQTVEDYVRCFAAHS